MLNIYHIHRGKIQHRLSHTTSLCLLQSLTYTTNINPSVLCSLMLNRFLGEVSYVLSVTSTSTTTPPKPSLTYIYKLILRSGKYMSKLNYYLLTGDNQ